MAAKLVQAPVLPPSRYEACPEFKTGSHTAGKWSFTKFDIPFGTSFQVKYEDKPVFIELMGMLFGGFDINIYKEKITTTPKLSVTTIAVPALTEQARAKIEATIQQAKADQLAILRAFKSYATANLSIKPDEEGRIIPPTVVPAIKYITTEDIIERAKKNGKNVSNPVPYHVCGISLKSIRVGQEISLDDVIDTTIVIGGKTIPKPSRKELNEMIKGKAFLVGGKANVSFFKSSLGLFCLLKSDLLHLKEIPKKVGMTEEERLAEIERMEQMFDSFGMDDKPESISTEGFVSTN